MKIFSRWQFLLWVSVLFWGSACPKRPPAIRLEPSKGEAHLAQILTRLKSRQQMTGVFKVKAMGPGALMSGMEVDFALLRPGKIHLAIRSFFGQPLQVVVADGERGELLDLTPEEGPTLYQGQARKMLRLGLLPFDLASTDIVDLLMGVIPQNVGKVLRYESLEPHDRRRLVLETPDATVLVVVLSTERQRLETIEKQTLDGSVLWSVAYGDHRVYEGESLAHRLRLKVQTGDQRVQLELNITELVLNGHPLGDEVFRLEPATGWKVVNFP